MTDDEPKTFEHERFGTFTLDRRADRYVANTTWAGQDTRLALYLSGTDVSPLLDPALLTALELWANQSTWNPRIQDYAVQQLLGIYNASWREEDESELTPDDFKARMSLDAVTVFDDGNFDFWYDDRGLFLGHAIQISGNLTDGLIRADIPG